MTAITTYEAKQSFNAVTRYLHSFRFRNLMACLTELSQQITDRPIEVLVQRRIQRIQFGS